MAFSDLFSFLTILKESFKLLPKNGKLMALIAVSYMVLSSVSFFLYSCSLLSLMKDMVDSIMQAAMPDPGADPSAGFDPTKASAILDNLRKYLALIFTVEIAGILAFSIISFFFDMAATLVSAFSYSNTTLSLKELFSILRKTWTRPLITTLYVSGLAIGYSICIVALTLPLLILYPNRVAFSVAIVIWIAASFLFLYLVVAWFLANVVSVVEENCYGTQALNRASSLVKGSRLRGFMLNLCLNILGVIIFLGFRMILGNKTLVNQTLYGLFVVNFATLLKILLHVAYTVLYFHCKKHHGEEIIELHGSVQYSKLPTTLLVNDADVP